MSSVSYVRTVPAVYLPTTENPDAYQTVVIERKAIFEPPPSVPKDAKTLDLEVRDINIIDLVDFRVCQHSLVPSPLPAFNNFKLKTTAMKLLSLVWELDSNTLVQT